jgi:hypothetical protein
LYPGPPAPPPTPLPSCTELASICHDNGVPLIVDEAHGAHFGPASLNLPRIFPPSALSCGADLVVQSTHKVLTSMTQTAMLHLKGDRVNPDRISAALQVCVWGGGGGAKGGWGVGGVRGGWLGARGKGCRALGGIELLCRRRHPPSPPHAPCQTLHVGISSGTSSLITAGCCPHRCLFPIT